MAMLFAIFSVSAESVYLKKSDVDYMKDGALVAAWCWGGEQVDVFCTFSPVSGDPEVAVAEIPNGTTGMVLVRFAAGTTAPAWDGVTIWNRTQDLNKPAGQNMLTLSQWDNEAGGNWSTYANANPNPDPTVNFTLPTSSTVNQTITLNATANGVENPVYVYSVKKGDGAYVELEGNSWTPTEAGVYTIKVEVKQNGSVVVSKELGITITETSTGGDNQEQIVVKVKIPSTVRDWRLENGVYFCVWGSGLSRTVAQATSEGNDWYSYAVSASQVQTLNFYVLNAPSEEALEGDPTLQTVQVQGITASICYVMDNGSEIAGGEAEVWKKVLNVTECPNEGGDSSAIEEIENAPLFSINGRTLNVALDSEAEISIYTISGQMIEHTIASDYAREMQQGIYVIRIGKTTQKAVIY